MSDGVNEGQTLLAQAGVIFASLTTFALGMFQVVRSKRNDERQNKTDSKLTEHQIMKDIIETLRTQLKHEEVRANGLHESLKNKRLRLRETQDELDALKREHALAGDTIAQLQAALDNEK